MIIQKAEQKLNCQYKNFAFDEVFHRTGKKKEFWAIGKEFNFIGKDYTVLSAGSWKTGERYSFKSWDKDLELKDKGFRKKVAKVSQELTSKVNLEEEEKWTAAKDKAQEEIKGFTKDLRSVQYLGVKKVEAFGNIFSDNQGNLIVPTYEDEESIVGFQKITQTGKWFQSGQKMRGVFFPIGNIRKSDVIYIAEGYATAATIHKLTGLPVIVAFTCHNISPVIRAVLSTYGHKKIVIAADNDEKKAGEIAAEKACKTFSSIQYVMPDFGGTLSKLSDFNDLYIADGADEATKQLSFDSSKFNHVSMLGHSENKYYFYSERSKTVRCFGLADMRSGDLVSMAKEDYWASRFSSKFETPEICDWKKTTELIVDKQEQEVGFYSPDKIRGFGFWNDGKDYIFNNSKEVFKNGQKVNFGYINNNYFYTPSGVAAVENKIFSPRIFLNLKKALDLTDFRSEKDRIGFLGFMAQAPVFSCLDWKSHIWFVGPAGSGKSTVQSLLSDVLVNSKLFQDSTAAGIRQTIKNDALVTIVDEAEGDQKNTQKLMDMARHASSGQNITVARGTPGGRAISQNVTTVFCFGSIQQPSMSIADESRVFNVSLKASSGVVNISKENERKDAYYEARKLGPDLFNYMTSNINVYKSKIKEVSKELLICGASTRQADQYSNLLAGYLMLAPDADMHQVLNTFLKEDKSALESIENFNDEFLETLKFLKIRGRSEEVLMGEVIQKAAGDGLDSGPASDFLKLYGVKIVGDFVHFSKNKSMKKELSSLDVPNYWSVLKNNRDNFEYSGFKWNGSKKFIRSYKISKKQLFE